MKNSILILFSFFNTFLLGQSSFILQGKLENFPGKELQFFFQNIPGITEIDTIHLALDGSFFYENKRLTRPQQTSIQWNNVQFNDIYIAPGFQLTLEANVVDYETLVKTRKISGIGAVINQYQFSVDTIFASDTTKWYLLSTPDLVKYAQSYFEAREALSAKMLGQPSTDPFFDYFKEVAKRNNEFLRANFLLSHFNFGNSYGTNSAEILSEFTGKDILKNLSNEKNLQSKMFLDGIVTSDYLRYMVNIDYKSNPRLREDENYLLRKAAELYSGQVKDYALTQLMIGRIYGTNSVEMLNDRLADFEPFIEEIQLPAYQTYLNQKIQDQIQKLSRIQEGELAPNFLLPDNFNVYHQLTDFQGKILYIDLWASWCAPCRAETPFLNDLIKQYEGNDQIEFISIAVRDDHTDWQNAILKDQPLSKQWYDEHRFVYSTYLLGSLPQFLIIDKVGNLAMLKAPRPSEKAKLTQVLDRLLNE
ncbi:MAG: TlpA disulfide reductase family protein [Saprospiraceae bacterium]